LIGVGDAFSLVMVTFPFATMLRVWYEEDMKDASVGIQGSNIEMFYRGLVRQTATERM
jgi:hypothetical protein